MCIFISKIYGSVNGLVIIAEEGDPVRCSLLPIIEMVALSGVKNFVLRSLGIVFISAMFCSGAFSSDVPNSGMGLMRANLSMNGQVGLWSSQMHPVYGAMRFHGDGVKGIGYVGGCPMHQADQPAVIKNKLALMKAETSAYLLLDLCAFRWEQGLSTFHDAVHLMRIDPFSMQNSNAMNEIRGPSEILLRTNKIMGPGRTLAKVPVDGQFAAMVWPRTLLVLAHGCRGVHFMTSTTQQETQRLQLIVEDQLRALKDTLSLWDTSVPLGEVDTYTYQVGAWLVRLQPTRLALVMVRGETDKDFDGRVRFQCVLPGGVQVSRAVDLTGAEVMRFEKPQGEFKVSIPHMPEGLIWYLDVQPPAVPVPAHAP